MIAPTPVRSSSKHAKVEVSISPTKSDLNDLISSPAKQPAPPSSNDLSSLFPQQDGAPSNPRLTTMMKNYEKHQNEKWKKALKHLGINENLFPNKKDEIETFFPFNDCNLVSIRAGHFLSRQLDKIVLEITNIDVVNSCFNVKFKDMHAQEISGVFHADCKDKIKAERMRKGSVVILTNVSD